MEYDKALNKAFKYLSFKMRTKKEMFLFLEKKGIEEKILLQVIDRLMELKYIDDKEYSRLFVQDKSNYCFYGRERIRYDLLKKGIDKGLIDDSLYKYLDEEKESKNIDILISKKLRILNLDNKKDMQKLQNYLFRKGFPRHLVYEKVRSFNCGD